MFISIKYRGTEHSYYPLTGEYFKVSPSTVTTGVKNAVMAFLKRKYPEMDIIPTQVTIEPVAGHYVPVRPDKVAV
jgi:hypothetical protein